MGYTTDFEGRFKVSPPMKPEHVAYINAFSGTRRMKRDALKASKLPDPLREAVGLPIGIQGAYYVGASSDGNYGQSQTPDVLEYNDEPKGQPSLWCQWVMNTDEGDSQYLEWDGGGKFYCYTEWLVYLIENFLKPWGYTVNGEVEWQGEESKDRGKLVVKDNKVKAIAAVVTYPDDEE